jgi:hypothetical protein
MFDARALWLIPGAEHPIFRRCAEFFADFFRDFIGIDYRAEYLHGGPVRLQQRVIETVRTARPDVLLYTQFPSSYSYLTPQFLGGLRDQCRVVGLGFDDEIYFGQAKYFYLHCDAVITTDIEGAARLRSAGVAAYEAQVTPQRAFAAVEEEDIPVSFIGDMSKPGRKDFVRGLEDAGIPVADFGVGSRHGFLTDDGMLDVFRRTCINLNFTRTNPPRWVLRLDPERAAASQIKGRPFELAALRKFCLTEWAPCVAFWFRPNEEIGVFRDTTELVGAVRRYLADADLRRGIAAAAHRRYLAEHALNVQFTRIFSAILAGRDGVRRIQQPRTDRIFHESMGRSRGNAFLHALRRGAPLRALREPFNASAAHTGYWRGFAGGVVGALAARL